MDSLNPLFFTEEERVKIKQGLEAEDFYIMKESLLSGFAKQRKYREVR